MYSSLMKKIKIYCNVKFHKYETAHNTDTSNKFQYAEFNEYKELETVKIDISKSTNQNTFTKFNIESFTEAQNINSFNTFQNVLSEPMNINIASYYSKHNQQPIYYQKNEFYYDFIHKIKTLQYIIFISAITLPVNSDSKNLHKVIICEN